MKGARGLLGGLLILAVVCVVPAMSAAQDNGKAETTTTTAAPDPGAPQVDPAPPPGASDQSGSSTSSGEASQGAGTGAPAKPRDGSGTPETATDDGSPTNSPSGGGPDPASRKAHSSATTVVTMGDYFFSPSTVTVAVGDIVTWRNEGREPHTATADDGSFDTGTVAAGGKASHMFDKPGSFSYLCTIHPNMKGTVRVVGSGGGGGAGTSSSSSGQTEAQAVNSPNAAGDANTLPMSGLAEGPLALVGLALLGSGLVVRRSARRLVPGRQLSLF
jgi:plastocyanin